MTPASESTSPGNSTLQGGSTSEANVISHGTATLPGNPNSRATLSDSLAAERTYLAWIRTGLALLGLGFVVARFGLFLERLNYLEHVTPARTYGLSVWFVT